MDVAKLGATPTFPQRKAPQPSAAPASASAATMPADSLTLQRKVLALELPPLKAGQKFEMDGEADGTSFGGTATVKARSDKQLEMTLNAKVLFFTKKIDLSIETRPDGSVKATAIEPGEEKPMFSGVFKLQSQEGGKAILKDASGKPGTLTQHPDGAISIQLDTIKLDLKA
ncbi:MAG TPA: hypothetical protein V6D00_12935 [Pantanalinema sp.]